MNLVLNLNKCKDFCAVELFNTYFLTQKAVVICVLFELLTKRLIIITFKKERKKLHLCFVCAIEISVNEKETIKKKKRKQLSIKKTQGYNEVFLISFL